MTSVRSQALLIFFAGILLFTIGQSQQIVGFESRFYVFALEMWRHGPSWFPTTYGKPYPDYPVTSTFFIYMVSLILGGLSRFSAIVPTAIAASISLAMTYLMGSLYQRTWGLAAVFFLLLTYAFVVEARTISLDQVTTAVTISCFYLVSSAKKLNKPHRIRWIYFLLVVGFAFRGPLGLVIPAGVVVTFFLLDKEIKKFLWFSLNATLLLIICSTLLLGLAYQVGDTSFLQNVLEKEVVGRLPEGTKNPPFYFYFLESVGAYAITYPLAMLLLLLMGFNFKSSPATQFLKKLLGWVLVILIGLSIPGDKKIRYILPCAPALALICGYLFVVTKETRILYKLKQLLLLFFGILPLIGLVGIYGVHHYHPELLFSYQGALWGLSILCFFMLLVHKRELWVLGVAVLSFFVLQISVVEPINVELNLAAPLVQTIEKLRLEKKAHLVFFRESQDALVIKYIAGMAEETQPSFIKTEKALKSLGNQDLLITSKSHYQFISKQTAKDFRIMLEGRLGREPIVVLMKR